MLLQMSLKLGKIQVGKSKSDQSFPSSKGIWTSRWGYNVVLSGEDSKSGSPETVDSKWVKHDTGKLLLKKEPCLLF